MDKRLAELILEYGEELSPYLKLRAKYIFDGVNDSVTVNDTDIDEKELKIFKESEFIDYEIHKDKYVVKMKDGERWLCDPEDIGEVKIRRTEEYVPKDLIDIIQLIHIPDDWGHSLPKYRKLHKIFKDKYSQEELIKIATYVKYNFPDVTLRQFFSNSFLSMVKINMETPLYNSIDRGAEYREDMTIDRKGESEW
jgi:hypothetical protein